MIGEYEYDDLSGEVEEEGTLFWVRTVLTETNITIEETDYKIVTDFDFHLGRAISSIVMWMAMVWTTS